MRNSETEACVVNVVFGGRCRISITGGDNVVDVDVVVAMVVAREKATDDSMMDW